jgi:hypothetical protein
VKAIKYISHKEINKQAWDNCVDNAVNQLVYAYAWYLDLVTPNWDALVLGNYEAIMPLPQRKRFTIAYLAQPFFTQQLGVFYSNLSHMHATNDFLAAIPDKFKLVELNFNTYNVPSNSNFEIKQNNTCILELSLKYNQIKNNYSAQILRNIKKAEHNNLTIDSDISVQIIIDLFKANRGKKIKNFNNKTYQLLVALSKVLESNKALYLTGVKNKTGNYIAGAIFIKYNDYAVFLFSGANEEAKKSGAMSLLIDNFIKLNASSPLILDFEGSNDKNLARFYLGFGSKSTNYFAVKKNNLPKIIRWVKR